MADEESHDSQPAENTDEGQKENETNTEGGILSSEQQDALKQAFDDIDIDHSGTISRSELRAALQLIGQNPTEAEIHTYMAGSSSEGQFTREEFCEFVEANIPLKTQEQISEELIDAFSKFDEDQDMFISKAEFRRVMTRKGEEPLTEAEADDLLERLDTVERDGQLNILELGKVFMGDV